jgi:hypothetical protein
MVQWVQRVAVRRVLVSVLMFAFCVGASGCGYALAGRGSFLPAYIRVVGIPQFENRTTFSVEQVLTEKVRVEFIGRGKYRIRPEIAGADAVLTGELTAFSAQPVGFTEQQLASRYLFTIQMRVRFTDARTGEVLWSDDALTFRSEYELSTRGNTTLEGSSLVDQERSAVERISNDMARAVVTAILEAF